MTGIIASTVQFFFAWRVKVVTGNWWLVALISTCALTGMRMAIFICCMHYLTVHPGSLVHWYFDCGWDNPRVPRIHQIQSNCNYLVSAPSTLHRRFSLISPPKASGCCNRWCHNHCRSYFPPSKIPLLKPLCIFLLMKCHSKSKRLDLLLLMISSTVSSDVRAILLRIHTIWAHITVYSNCSNWRCYRYRCYRWSDSLPCRYEWNVSAVY